MNKLVKIEDLLEGDEIIISGNSNLKYMKVLKTPIISNVKKCWGTGLPLHTAVRCSIRQDSVQSPHHENYFYKEYQFEQDITKHNHKISIDLNNRHIFLVKRETPKKEGIYE